MNTVINNSWIQSTFYWMRNQLEKRIDSLFIAIVKHFFTDFNNSIIIL
jgi:hypothetical protein